MLAMMVICTSKNQAIRLDEDTESGVNILEHHTIMEEVGR